MKNKFTNPVEYRSPSFHGDALEHCEHGEEDVVEARYSVVRPLPLLQALGYPKVAGVRPGGRRLLATLVARNHLRPLRHYLLCNSKL